MAAPGSDPNTTVPTLVLFHDALGSPQEFSSIAQILGARDVPFDFMEIPGYTHGRGRRELGWRGWLRAASGLLDARHRADSPIVLGGLGAGGALAAALALESRRQRVCGVAMLSPTFTRDGPANVDSAWWRVASALRLDGGIEIAKREPFGIKNPKMRKWVVRELEERGISSIGPARVPLRALRESDRLHAHVRASLAALPAPLLVLHATDDEISGIAGVTGLVARLGDRARLIPLAHSHHRITVDNDRQRVAHELADFVGAPKRAAGPVAPVRRPRREPSGRSETFAAA